MTKQRRFKRQVRDRMSKTGERYAAARGALTGELAERGGPAAGSEASEAERWTPTMADDTLAAATGRTWAEWLELLDAADATALSHAEVARHLVDAYGISGWWAQTVTVGYEQARGLRRKHERPDGFEISKSKTVPVPVEALYAAWSDEELRARWLPEPIEISSQRAHRTLNARWLAGQGRITVRFEAKGAAKSQVSLGHHKLDGPDEAERMKQLWTDRLARLAGMLSASSA